MKKAEFFEMVGRVIEPAATTHSWAPGREGLFVRDEGDFILTFAVPYKKDTQAIGFTANVSITSRKLNDSNLTFSQQKPVKSAKTQARLALGCPLHKLSVQVSVEGSSWEAAGAELVKKCTEEAKKIREKYGSIEKIKEFYEDLYKKEPQSTPVQALMCINMMQGNYEEALTFIAKVKRPLPLDKDYTIWGYAERHARKMLDTRASHSIH